MLLKSKRQILLAFFTMFALVAGLTASPAAAHSSHEESRKEARGERRAERANRRAIPRVPGSVYTLSDQSFTDTVDSIRAAIEGNPNLAIPLIVDHAAAAASVGLDLDPNTVIFFGNPNIGTPLMQADQLAGIDLPQKIHVIEENGRVFVGYNDPYLLAARHDVKGQPNLETIAGALANITAAGTGEDALSRSKSARRFIRRDGLTTVKSDADIDTTWNRLLATINASPANIALQLDHQANAARVGLELNPTRLVVFGNPNIGTPLMQARASAGIDLPLKILVWEDDNGHVFVSTNDTRYLKRRHRLRKVNLDTVGGALNNFVTAATVTSGS